VITLSGSLLLAHALTELSPFFSIDRPSFPGDWLAAKEFSDTLEIY
jgi:hypothetical protein